MKYVNFVKDHFPIKKSMHNFLLQISNFLIRNTCKFSHSGELGSLAIVGLSVTCLIWGVAASGWGGRAAAGVAAPATPPLERSIA